MAGSIIEVTDAQLPGRGHRVRYPGARRLLGPLVRPVPRRRPRARGDQLRARRSPGREAQRRRQPADGREPTGSWRSRPCWSSATARRPRGSRAPCPRSASRPRSSRRSPPSAAPSQTTASRAARWASPPCGARGHVDPVPRVPAVAVGRDRGLARGRDVDAEPADLERGDAAVGLRHPHLVAGGIGEGEHRPRDPQLDGLPPPATVRGRRSRAPSSGRPQRSAELRASPSGALARARPVRA